MAEEAETNEVFEETTQKKTRTRSSKTAASGGRKAPAKKVAPATAVTFSAGDDAEPVKTVPDVAPMTALLFQEPDVSRAVRSRRTRREEDAQDSNDVSDDSGNSSDSDDSQDSQDAGRKRRRGTRGGRRTSDESQSSDSQNENDAADEGESNDSSTKDKQSRGASQKRTSRKKASTKDDSNTDADSADEDSSTSDDLGKEESSTRTRRRTRSSDNESDSNGESEGTVRRRRRRRSTEDVNDEVTAPKGSTRLEAKRQRRKEGREAGRRRQTITESEYLARRESVARDMLIREQNGLNQIAVIEDGILVEHYVARHTQTSMVGNVYLGRVQNVLPSMEAAFVDIGKGRNAVLYAGEVNWEAAGMEGKPRKIEQALKSGDTVLVQVTKDPIGHKGARLTAQITLAGRHLVLVPSGAMTGISRKLPDRERARLKKILKEVVPSEHGVIVRTAAEGATEEQLRNDVERLTKAWSDIQSKSKHTKNAPSLLKGEPELAVRVVRDIFNEDFKTLKVEGDNAWETISEYVEELSPELVDRLEHWEKDEDIFAANRVDEQLAKAFDRKVFLPSGGSLVIDRTEAMTVVDVNTGKFTGSGGSLEETVTRNNLEAAEEIVRQLRLRDIGGIIVIDFIDMVLEANRDLVLRRLIECLGRDRTRHQVAEVTSLGLVQMTRKRVGQGLVEAFSTTCEACEGRGYISHDHPVEKGESTEKKQRDTSSRSNNSGNSKGQQNAPKETNEPEDPNHAKVKAALANIAAAASHKHEEETTSQDDSKSASRKRNTRGRSRNQRRTDDAGGAASEKQAGADEVGESRQMKSEAVKADETKAAEAQATKRDTSRDESAKPDTKTTDDTPKKPATRRRVTSSGTITPSSSPTSAIMSFPVKASEETPS